MSLHLQGHGIEKGTLYYYSLLKEGKVFTPKVPESFKNSNDTKAIKERNDDEEEEEEGEQLDIAAFLEEFVQFKLSIDGGQREQSTVSQSKQQLQLILNSLKSKDLADLFCRFKLRDSFLSVFCKEQKYKPLTIKRYLLSLVHLYDFVLSEEKKVPGVAPERVLQMKCVVNNWSKSYNSSVEEHHRLREMDEQEV